MLAMRLMRTLERQSRVEPVTADHELALLHSVASIIVRSITCPADMRRNCGTGAVQVARESRVDGTETRKGSVQYLKQGNLQLKLLLRPTN